MFGHVADLVIAWYPETQIIGIKMLCRYSFLLPGKSKFDLIMKKALQIIALHGTFRIR